MEPSAIVLVMDRLGCGYLGPYGNTWIETPAWNRLGAQGTLFENALIDSPELPQLYHSYWRGCHALASPAAHQTTCLPDLLAEDRIESWLITDERLVAEQAAAQKFHQRVVLPPGEDTTADDVEETQLARMFATAIEVIQQARPPFLVWVHAQAMQAPWDAPYHLRAQFAEEDDPTPPAFAKPPDQRLTDDYDPDWLLGVQHAYAGQVALLDTCLGVLLDWLWSSHHADSTALVTTAARGFPLGEHRYVGNRELPLFGELIHVPWIQCWPQATGATFRIQQPLVQPPDLYHTLVGWLNPARSVAPGWGISLLPQMVDRYPSATNVIACSLQEQQRAIRVPAWFLRTCEGGVTDLYAKPDDRWEFNEISSRCGDVVEQLLEVLAQFARAADRTALPQLSERLLRGLD